jgi:UDP-GlcNAc:undecaprenyl-phosphate GlcNAc-1-phosphate transferase
VLTYLVAAALSGLVALGLTPVVRWAAHRLGLVDAPSEARKVHVLPVPRLGGIAIAVAFFVPIFGLFFWSNDVSTAYLGDVSRVVGLFGGAAVVVLLGLSDDLLDLKPRFKLSIQLAVAVAVYLLGYQIPVLANPFGPNLALGWLSLPVTVLWIVGVMNAINLIDGLDGLASGVSLFTVLTLFVLAVLNGNVIVGLTSAALAGALLGFLRYNFNPASIFMGDAGSLFLGFVLATTAISGSAKSSTVVAMAIPLLALGLPLLDTSVAIVRRFVAGRPIFGADRGHVHHRLLDRGLSHRQVVLVLYGVCLLFAGLALATVYANSVVTAIILGVFLVAVLTFGKLVGLLDLRAFNQSVRYGLLQQQRARAHLQALQRAVERVRAAESPAEVIEAVEAVGLEAHLDAVYLRAEVTGGPTGTTKHDLAWLREATSSDQPGPAQHLEVPLDWSLGPVEIAGRLAFAWHTDGETLQIPESVGYQLLGVTVRDRLLQLARRSSVVPAGPRLVSKRS